MGNFCETCHTEPTYYNTIQETSVINTTTIHIKSGNILEESEAIVFYVTPFLDALNEGQNRLMQYFLPYLSKRLIYMKKTEVLSYGSSVAFRIEDEEEAFQWVILTVLPLDIAEMCNWFNGLRDVIERKEIGYVSMPFQSIPGFSKEQLAHSFISILTSSIIPETHSFLSTINIYCNEGVLLKTLSKELGEHSEGNSVLAKKRVNSYEKEIIGIPVTHD